MKNVVFVIESLNLGGAETSLVTLLNNIDYSKYSVDLLLFTKENYFISYLPDEVNVIYVDFPDLNIIERIKFKFLKIINQNNQHPAQLLWSIIKSKITFFDKKYDLAHAYNQGFSTYYTANFIKAKVKLAWINIDYQKARYNIQYDYKQYAQFNKIIAISDEVKRGFEEELQKVNCNYSTVIIKLFTDENLLKKRSEEPLPLVFDNNKINIVTTCRLSKQKGLHLVIESCYKLIKNGYSVHWYIVGEGNQRNFLEGLIKKYNLQNHITLVGVTKNPFPFMKACDIYVQTSLFEGWGLTVVEAVLLNKLVVTTNFPTAYNIIEDGKTGLICEMNSNEISKNIERFILEKDLIENIKINLSNRKNADKEESLNKFEILNNTI
jgi:glycosyltransferase involved in cell wall biosynthesis